MKAVRIYKDNFREHILRTLFFNDTAIFLSVGVFLAVVTFSFYQFVFHYFQWGPYLMTVFVLEVFFALAATVQIDNQSIYKLIPRAVTFNSSKKKLRQDDLTESTSDFTVTGDYINRKKKLIAVFRIEPFDIALLNDEDREQFYHHIKMMLHTLPAKMQLIVRKEKANPLDYQKHFFSVYKQADKDKEDLIDEYIDDLTDLIDSEQFFVMKYYAVFSTTLQSEKETHFFEATKRLSDISTRFSSSLTAANVTTAQLQHEALVSFCKSQLTNI